MSKKIMSVENKQNCESYNQIDWLSRVLRPTRYKIGHFGDVTVIRFIIVQRFLSQHNVVHLSDN